QKLCLKPDIFLVDAHGFAHPYRCGLASHLGIMIGEPTIGIAKGWLFGNQEAGSRNDIAFLKAEDEVIGAVIGSKSGEKPVYVSVGHMVSLETAIKIVKHCTSQTRIPEPILKAHQIAASEREKMKSFTINRLGMR
ncbi:MAG: endonuclease V, partial [Candidatus Korarchaeota archaeon]|nr:endonuclease V [Candidatus Korarchaeota archaeon]